MTGTVSFEALPSPRPGEVRWRDIRSFVAPGEVSVTVVILGLDTPPATVTLAIAGRWTGTGWARMLACPRCANPAGVLRQHEGALLCPRCRPALTARQSRHNTREWALGGELEDKLVRAVLGSGSSTEVNPVADELLARDAAIVDALVRETGSVLAAVDDVLVAQQIGGIDEER